MNLSDFSIANEVADYCRKYDIPQPSNCWGSLENYDKTITFVWAVDGFPELIAYYEITAYSPTWVFSRPGNPRTENRWLSDSFNLDRETRLTLKAKKGTIDGPQVL